MLLFLCRPVAAAPVGTNEAANAVQGWLRQDPRPLGKNLSARIQWTEAVRDAAGEVVYYAVHLNPAGYVIVAGDDTVEPFIAFSAGGDFEASAREGVAAWVNQDLPRRLARARAAAGERERQAQRKWGSALAASLNPPPDLPTNNYVVLTSQIWVSPFLQTWWDQQSDLSLSEACFNYYTPPYGTGNLNNDPCGCIATAMAQVMGYYHYPTASVGTAAFSITNNGAGMMANLRGGNGTGGPYSWTNMPPIPNNPTTTQAQAIGALCYDAALTVNMDFAAGGSEAYDVKVKTALTGTFQYGGAAYGYNNNNTLSGTNLLAMINPCVDARMPVLLGILTAGNEGHEVVCDGYGYSGSTLFHHLNMGWAGANDVWYALPNIDTYDGSGDFTIITDCIYDIYTNSTGLVLSGRVTDAAGAPVAGASVTAKYSSGIFMTTADTNGIYALIKLPANTQLTVTVTNAGCLPASANYTTGQNTDNTTKTGNIWGANFTLTPTLLAVPESGWAASGPVGGPFNFSNQVYSLTNGTTAAINWAASSPPAWLNLSTNKGTVAAGAATNFSISLSAVAAGLAAGSNTATIWITNQTTGLAQGLPFSLAVAAADYPIAVTGFNDDVVVEKTATGGDSYLYADIFDTNNTDFNAPYPSFSFYEHGLVAINDAAGGAASVAGLPSGGLFTSAADGATIFQLGPYAGYNVLALSAGGTTGTLTLATPQACKSLSVLAATAEGGGNGTMVLNFADGTHSSPLVFNAANYYTYDSPGTGVALSQFGLLRTGDYNEFSSFDASAGYPMLYQTTANLEAAGLHTKPVSSVTFTMPGGQGTNAVTGIFALSGTLSPYPMITAQPQNAAIGVGSNAAFSVGVSGGAPLAYRWRLNGAFLTGAQTNPVLNVTNAGYTNAGYYQVVITNTAGAVTSSVATLSLTNLPVRFVTGGKALQYGGGQFILQLTNLAGQGAVVVSASTNLIQWTPVFTNPSGFGSFNYTDVNARVYPHRFYQATAP
jgi:hypothetical protein